MALKALMLRKNIDSLNKSIASIEEKAAGFEQRESELVQAIEEAETEEERSVCESEVESFEAEKKEVEEKRAGLQAELEELEAALEEEERKNEVAVETERKEEPEMEEKRTVVEEEMQARSAFADFVRGIETREYDMTQGNNGVVVPKTIAKEIIEKVKEISPVFEMAHKYPVKGTFEIPYYPYDTVHAVAAAYMNEMDELVAASGDFGTIELTGYLAGALAKISKKLINNTDIDVVPFMVEQMAKAFRDFYEHEAIVGTTGKATGILAGIDASATITAAKKSSVKTDELIDVQCAIPTALQKDCRWLMHPSTFKEVRKLKDGQGNYILCPDFRQGFGYVLLGKPVDLSENMPVLGTSGNKAIVYGDYSGLAIKNTEDLEIQLLQEKFATQHAIGIVGWTEIDTKVENAQKFACIKCGASD